MARLLFSGVFALLCLPLFVLPADTEVLEGLALQTVLTDDAAQERFAEGLPGGGVRLVWDAADRSFLGAHADALRSALKVSEVEISSDGAVLSAGTPVAEAAAITYRVSIADGREMRVLDPSGELLGATVLGSRVSLVPPLLAILLAFLLRSSLPSLFLGALLGSFLLVPHGQSILRAFEILFVDIIYKDILRDSFHVYILGFVFLLSATVAVITRMGGIEGLVMSLVRYAKSSRSVQAVAYFLGFAIFFDDYANTIVVGNSAGPLFDKLRVSRAKLAYIVDSTAAPVAGVAILSTWVAYQISTYAPQLPTIGMEESQGYALFLETIPYRFYCLLALMMVGLTILMQRDIGPMRRTEAEARNGNSDLLVKPAGDWSRVERSPSARPFWLNGLLPLLVMVLGTGFLIYLFGAQAIPAERAAELRIQGLGVYLREVLAESDSTKAIFFGSLAAWAVAALLAIGQRQLPVADVATTTGKGLVSLIKDAILILILAWAIGRVCGGLGTAGYLVAVFTDLIDPSWLPIILFVASCFVAFATGSSWTTMAILQPNVVLLADRLGEGSALGSQGLLILSIGAVLEGSIFGDHCSPISDTTILSSTASRVRHIDHVRTQAPYALVCAFIALLAGYVPAAFFGAPPLLSLATGLVLLVATLRLFGAPSPRGVAAGTTAPLSVAQPQGE